MELDLQSILENIASHYGTARSSLIGNLETCLSIKSTDEIDSVCQPVLSNTATTAYDWYKANPVSNASTQQQLLQNAIALQYTGTLTNRNSSSWPQDVVYVHQLPSWSTINQFVLIGDQAALVLDSCLPG